MTGSFSSSSALAAIRAFEPDLVALRRDFHRHPELGFEEHRTAAIVARELRAYGLDVTEGVGGTGVVATLCGRKGTGRTIALRADMDALPIVEDGAAEHRSSVPGRMHACGHDGHMAMLLGAARHLARKDDFAGTVRFVFQPAEEGLGGARAMLEDGLFERFPVDAIYGMHNAPGLKLGTFALRSGAMMAASDIWTVVFHGTGGHGGAAPHLAVDPTLAQAQFILSVQSIVSRNVPALEPAVLSVGHIVAGEYGAPNVIPALVTVRGTARCFAPAVRDTLERRLRECAVATAALHGASAEVTYERRYPPLVNHADQTQIAARAAASLVGATSVVNGIAPLTGSEDFAFLLERKQGAFILLGIGETAPMIHTPRYDFNDAALSIGAAYWCSLVATELFPCA